MNGILATVEYPQSRKGTVDLTEANGWLFRGVGLGIVFENLLDRMANPDDFGPADGDPVACAAAKAAELLSGVVTYVREPDPVPDDAVF